MRKTILYNIIASVLLISFYACSDDSTSPEEEVCELSLPTAFVHAEIDVSYFEEQEDLPDEEQYAVYKQVEEVALLGSSVLDTGDILDTATNLLTFAHSLNIQPDFEAGACIWQIEISEAFLEDGDLSVTVTGTQVSGAAEWEIEATGTVFGNEVENFRLLTGVTADDESNGEWNVYSQESGNTPVLTYSWDIEAADDYEVDLSSLELGSVNYSKDSDENYMTIINQTTSDSTSIHWNEETDSGWIEAAGQERQCYENFINAACE